MIENLVVTNGNDPEFLRIVTEICLKLKAKNRHVEVLDISAVISGKNAYHLGILHAFRIETPSKRAYAYLHDNGVKVNFLQEIHDPNSRESLTVTECEKIAEAVQSTLVSLTKSAVIKSNFSNKRAIRKLTWESILIFHSILDFVGRGKVQTIHLPNGRFSWQRPIELVGIKFGCSILYYERGTYENQIPRGIDTFQRLQHCKNYWHHEFSALDRVKIQDWVSANSSLVSASREDASRLLLEKTSSPELSNKVLGFYMESFNFSNFRRNQTHNCEKKLRILIGTSSEDELAELGPIWRESSWPSQFEGFISVIERASRSGIDIVLRIHPHTREKSSSDRIRVRKFIKEVSSEYPEVTVVNAESSLSTYQLIEESDAVVVWNSTLGLESVFMGKPVACLQSSAYDQIADICRWHSVQAIDFDELLDKQVNRESSIKYLAGTIALDEVFYYTGEHWLNMFTYLSNPKAVLANRYALANSMNVRGTIALFLPFHLMMTIRRLLRKIPFYKR